MHGFPKSATVGCVGQRLLILASLIDDLCTVAMGRNYDLKNARLIDGAWEKMRSKSLPGEHSPTHPTNLIESTSIEWNSENVHYSNPMNLCKSRMMSLVFSCLISQLLILKIFHPSICSFRSSSRRFVYFASSAIYCLLHLTE